MYTNRNVQAFRSFNLSGSGPFLFLSLRKARTMMTKEKKRCWLEQF